MNDCLICLADVKKGRYCDSCIGKQLVSGINRLCNKCFYLGKESCEHLRLEVNTRFPIYKVKKR